MGNIRIFPVDNFERKSSIKKSSFFSFLSGMIPLFILAHFSHHVLVALLRPLLPFIRDDFALSYTQAGWVVSAFTLAYGISHLPAGWLADRVGPRLLITVGISGAALCGLLIGLSPTYVMMVVFWSSLEKTGATRINAACDTLVVYGHHAFLTKPLDKKGTFLTLYDR